MIGDIIRHVSEENGECDADGKLDDEDTLAIGTAAMASTIGGTLALMGRMIDALEG